MGSCPDTDIDPNDASNSLTLRGDNIYINIHTLSNKQVMRIAGNLVLTTGLKT